MLTRYGCAETPRGNILQPGWNILKLVRGQNFERIFYTLENQKTLDISVSSNNTKNYGAEV